MVKKNWSPKDLMVCPCSE